MEHPPARFFFDYVDPLSYLVERELAAAAAADYLPPVARVPFELRVPPQPLLDPDAPGWRRRWEAAAAAAAGLGIRISEPALLPWTRKAHELVLHASSRGLGEAAHRAVFDAVFLRGLDVGRVDVLVELARELGLDAMATRAVLDVDRHAAEVAAGRADAAQAGVADVPTLAAPHGVLEGFRSRDALRTFLLR